MEVTYDCTNILYKGNCQIDVTFLDFCNTFDVTPYHCLFMELYMYGITDKTNRWINGFLRNRSQVVVDR